MKRLQKEKNEINKKINELVWDIKMKGNKIIELEKEVKEFNDLLEFLIKCKEM